MIKWDILMAFSLPLGETILKLQLDICRAERPDKPFGN